MMNYWNLLSTFLAIIMFCISWGFHGDKIIASKGNSDVLLNSSLCQKNSELSQEDKLIQILACKHVLGPDVRNHKNKNTKIISSDQSDQWSLAVTNLDRFNPIRNINEYRINNDNILESQDIHNNDVQVEDTKPKRQQGNRACRITPQTYRENEPLPWMCKERKEWQALPDNFYPNRVYTTVCESSSCMNGHFNCTPVTYVLHLLKMCYGEACNDDKIPFSLRSSWTFHEHQVVIGCSCTR